MYQTPTKVRNPLTGRYITVNGDVYRRLIRQGIIQPQTGVVASPSLSTHSILSPHNIALDELPQEMLETICNEMNLLDLHNFVIANKLGESNCGELFRKKRDLALVKRNADYQSLAVLHTATVSNDAVAKTQTFEFNIKTMSEGQINLLVDAILEIEETVQSRYINQLNEARKIMVNHHIDIKGIFISKAYIGILLTRILSIDESFNSRLSKNKLIVGTAVGRRQDILYMNSPIFTLKFDLFIDYDSITNNYEKIRVIIHI